MKPVLPGRAPRFDLSFPFAFRREGELRWHEGITENISRSGVLFRARDLIPPSTPVEMRFELPASLPRGSGGLVSCRGRVVRTIPAETADVFPGLAATFARFRLMRGVGLAVP